MPSYSPTRCYFYPRSPCGERQTVMNNVVFVPGFLSTLSLRRATLRGWTLNINGPICLSTLSLRRATVLAYLVGFVFLFLSTLSLRRATSGQLIKSSIFTLFLSTLSLRRATTWARGSRVTYVISIHALLAESDILGRVEAV